MFLHDIDHDEFDIAHKDTLLSPQNWDDEPFEVIVSNPPCSIKWEGDDNYVGIEEIDPCMLRERIKAIYGEAPDKSSGKRRQEIHIQYDSIGFIPLNELAQKETA